MTLVADTGPIIALAKIKRIDILKELFDMADKATLEQFIPLVVMPKKGRRNGRQKAVESTPVFIRFKNSFSPDLCTYQHG